MNKTLEDKILSLHQENQIRVEIAKTSCLSTSTVSSVLRKYHKIKSKRNLVVLEKAIKAHQLNLTQEEAAKYANTCQSEISRIWYENDLSPINPFEHISEQEYKRRIKFLQDHQIDYKLIEHFWVKQTSKKYLPTINQINDSIEFFKELNPDFTGIFHHNPSLLNLHIESNLKPKLIFFEEVLKIPRGKIGKKYSLFLNSIEKMQKIYLDFSLYLGKNQATRIFSQCPDLLGYEYHTLFSKAIILESNGIDFRNNSTILEKKVNEVINTKEFLDKLSIDYTKGNFMLLLLNSGKIKDKISLLEDYGINWRKKPRLLLLSIGNEKNPGTLQRRINLINEKFYGNLPTALDYKTNAGILLYTDKEITKIISRYIKRI